MTAVWRCAQCGREQGEDIEQPCACSAGDGSWVFDRHIDRDEEPEQPTALDYCPKPNTP